MPLGLGRKKGNSLFRLCPQLRLLRDLSKQPKEGNDGQEEMLTTRVVLSLSTRVRVCLTTHTCTKVLNFHTVIRNWRDGEIRKVQRSESVESTARKGYVIIISTTVTLITYRGSQTPTILSRILQFNEHLSPFSLLCSLSSRYSMMAFPSFLFGFFEFSRVIIPLSNSPLLLFCILTHSMSLR